MKKQYMIPATEVMLIECASFIANSLKVNSKDTDEVITTPTEILSRKSNNIWDDEE